MSTKIEDTLDESIKETIKWDIMTIYAKMKALLFNNTDEEFKANIKNWDLWGPFFFILI